LLGGRGFDRPPVITPEARGRLRWLVIHGSRRPGFRVASNRQRVLRSLAGGADAKLVLEFAPRTAAQIGRQGGLHRSRPRKGSRSKGLRIRRAGQPPRWRITYRPGVRPRSWLARDLYVKCHGDGCKPEPWLNEQTFGSRSSAKPTGPWARWMEPGGFRVKWFPDRIALG